MSECDLADIRTLRHPGALHVLDVVEENPGQRLCPQIFSHASGLLHFEHGMLRLKGPADKRSKSTAAVLLIANAPQMFDAVVDCLDVTEHHRSARVQTQLMRDLHHLQPFIAVDFQRRNLLPHAIHQYFTAAARN